MTKTSTTVAEIIARGQKAMEDAKPGKLGLACEKISKGSYVIRYAGKTYDVVNYRYLTRVRHWDFHTVWQATQREDKNENLDAPTLRDMKKLIIFGEQYKFTAAMERDY